ncbi:MAG: hypothetical protein M3Z07_01940 [Candidatus Eremiobacteraeota bacterium]|nr:hypothetical protein [Candidatus Eremiobacteraeota bacterium]
MIRQNAAGSAAVLGRLLEVLTFVLTCERNPSRVDALQRHADLVAEDAARSIQTPADRDDVRRRHAAFTLVRQHGPLALIGELEG